MIRNIIFDLGQILFEFTPKSYLSQNFPKEKVNILMKEVFKEKEWKDLDRGTCNVKEAIEDIVSRGNVNYEDVNSIFSNRKSIAIPIEENLKLLEPLKENGYKIFILSNFHKDLFEDFYSEIAALRHIDGKVISSYVNLLKPEEEIYNHILKKYQLTPDETLFIDDTKHNIEAANKLGIKGLHLKNHKLLKKELEDLEIL